MRPGTNGLERSPKLRQIQDGPKWVFIVGGALLSTLSIRIGWKLKQFLVRKQSDNSCGGSTENGGFGTKKRSGSSIPRSIHVAQNGSSCCDCLAGNTDINRDTSCSTLEEDSSLPLAILPKAQSSQDNNVAIWASSAELPRKPFHHSNSSESLQLSECGSDIYTKRDVVNKLRKQLKRRDEMIIEMQAQLRDLQNSLTSQMTHSTHLQSLLDSANKDLLDSEREIQQMPKTNVDHHAADIASPRKTATSPGWQPEANGHSNGHLDNINALDLHCVGVDRGSQDRQRVEMLKREVEELKEVIEGKEFLLQSYKEQKTELTVKVKELQQRLTYQVPNIL